MYKFINNINKNPIKTNQRQTKTMSSSNSINQFEAKTFALFSQPYLDIYNQCYKNIIVVNLMPKGPLSEFVR